MKSSGSSQYKLCRVKPTNQRTTSVPTKEERTNVKNDCFCRSDRNDVLSLFVGGTSNAMCDAMMMMQHRRWCLTEVLVSLVVLSHSFTPTSSFKNHLAFVGGLSSGAKKRYWHRLSSTAAKSLDVATTVISETIVDDRPHEQRATRPRTARRLNHSFRYLYRHDDDRHKQTSVANLSALDFLMHYGVYTKEQVYDMNATFPPLLDLDVRRHLWPKLRFLQETIGVEENEHLAAIPPQFFGARLERTIAPRHAFLVHQGLPHGSQLLQQSESSGKTRLEDFLVSCRRTKQFCALCNEWGSETQSRVTAKQIEAFDVLFQRGLMAAARNELCQNNNSWPLQHVNITSGEVVSLVLQHGGNPMELDARGVSLLHWAAGCGNLGAVKVLLPYFQDGVFTKAERDGATPFHWAAAGAKAREFGCGGHVDVCRYFLQQLNPGDVKRIINTVTKDGNSVLMWAAWAGALDVVKLLVRNRADARLSNRNGCTVAHWASSGGDLSVCRYLAETVGVDFTQPNFGGNTPLTHAVAFGRTDVTKWLRNNICADDDDAVAADLAATFVGWSDGDRNRKEVLSLFDDRFGQDDVIDVDDNDESEDDEEIGSC